MYEKNESIPEEIDELIDDYGDFFRQRSMNPVNEEMMTFKESDCIWIGKKFPRKKKKKYEAKDNKVAWFDSQGSDDVEEPENNDILFGNIIVRPAPKVDNAQLMNKISESESSNSREEEELDHLDIFFNQIKQEDEARFKKEILKNDKKPILWEDVDCEKLKSKENEDFTLQNFDELKD